MKPELETVPAKAMAHAKAIHEARTEKDHCAAFNAAARALEEAFAKDDPEAREFWRLVFAACCQLYGRRNIRFKAEYHNSMTAAAFASGERPGPWDDQTPDEPLPPLP